MATQARKLTEREVRWARAFLHAIHGNEANGYLLRAVVAWMRADIGVRRMSAGAAARMLMHPGDGDKGFRKILLAARRTPRYRNAKQQDEALATQAKDFMGYLAESTLDDRHYGMLVYSGSGMSGGLSTNQERNHIRQIWYALTGMKIPDKWFIDGMTQPPPPPKQPPPAPAPFRQARTLHSDLPKSERIAPYAARDFYEERRLDNILLVD